MSDIKYDIFLAGSVLPSVSKEECIEELARLLKRPQAQAALLLQGKPTALKRGVPQKQAVAYKQLLESKGVEVTLKPHSTAAEKSDAGSQSSAAASPSAVKDSSVSVPAGTPEQTRNQGIAELIENIRGVTLQPKLSFASRSKMVFAGFIAGCVLFLLACFTVSAVLGAGWGLWLLISGLISSGLGATLTGLLVLLIASIYLFSVTRFVFAARHIARAQRSEDLLSESANNPIVSYNLILLTKHLINELNLDVTPAIRFSAQVENSAANTCLMPGKRGPNIVVGLTSVLAVTQAELVASLAAVVAQLRHRVLLQVGSSIAGLLQVCHVLLTQNDVWSHFYQLHARVNLTADQEQPEIKAGKVQKICLLLLDFQAKVYLPLAWVLRNLAASFENAWVHFKDSVVVELLGSEGFETYLQKLYHCDRLLCEQRVTTLENIKKPAPELVDNVPLVVAAQVQVHIGNEAKKSANDKQEQDAFFASVVGMHPMLIKNGPTCFERISKVQQDVSPTLTPLDAPAHAVVEQVHTLGQKVTGRMYAEYGISPGSYTPLSSQNYLKMQGVAGARAKVLDQYFNGWFNVDTFWRFGPLHSKDEGGVNTQLADINRLVRVLRHSSPDYQATRRSLPDLRQRYYKHRLALEVHKGGYRNDASLLDELGIVPSQVAELGERLKHHKKNVDEAEAALQKLIGFMGGKISLVAGLVKENQLAKQIRSTVSTLAKLQVVAQAHKEMWPQCVLLSQLSERMVNAKEPAHEARIKRLRKLLEDNLHELNNSLTRFNWLFGDDYENLKQRLTAENGRRPPSLRGEAYESPEKWMTPINNIAAKAPKDAQLLQEFCDFWHSLCAVNYELNMRLAVNLKKVEVAHKVPQIKIASTD